MARGQWPATVPAIDQLLADGLDLSRVTVLVGENGSGKSTMVEAVAMACGMNPEGGSSYARHRTRDTESDLWKSLSVQRSAGATRWGYFLRAETMHSFFSYLEDNPSPYGDSDFHRMSHGESFVEVLKTRFNSNGLYILDEPESALSFSACLALVSIVNQHVEQGNSQFVISTHSPIIASIPSATILELGDWGFHERDYDDLALVHQWSTFMRDRRQFLSEE